MDSAGADTFFTFFPILFIGLSILLTLLPLILLIIVMVFVVRLVRRMEHRAEENLTINRASLALQQEQLDLLRAQQSTATNRSDPNTW